MRRLLLAVALTVVAASIAAAGLWRELHRPYRGYEEPSVTVEVPGGASARAILELLERRGVIRSALLARAYFAYALDSPPLKAGEYRFERPLSLPEVLHELARGAVLAYPVTLVEGLNLTETARSLADGGFGSFEELVREMSEPDRIADLDPGATDLEGYLFPDTYHFARGTSASEIVDTLLATFRQKLGDSGFAPASDPRTPTEVRRLVTLASIVEREAGSDDERPVIAGVFTNRMRLGMPLQADPTVIFALQLLGRWDGNLRRPDLQIDSPYNTYRYPGLPPGPICSPGLASLSAAVSPADVPYLFFVSRNDGTHVFAASLAEHNRNVERWQKEYWRRRWAEERRAREESLD